MAKPVINTQLLQLLTGSTEAQRATASQKFLELGAESYAAKKYRKALPYYELAAIIDQNNHEAWTMLGIMYFGGEGIPLKDHQGAIHCFELASEQGNIGAPYYLGMIYYEGVGATQDFKKAKEYMQKAAELGNSEATYQLGVMYQYGQGTEKDMSKAKELYKIAMKAGNEKAKQTLINLGVIEPEHTLAITR